MKNLFFLLVLIFSQSLYSQNEYCLDFNDRPISSNYHNPLDNWIAKNGNFQYSNQKSQNGIDDIYLRAYDRSGSSWAWNLEDFTGDWSEIQEEKCLCYDFRIFNGIEGTDSISASFYIFNGDRPDAADIMAYFVMSEPLDTSDGWRTICPPLGLSSNGQLPYNDDGQWHMYGGGTSSGWDSLIQNINGIALRLDLPNGGPFEIYGYDNICIKNCKSDEACGQIEFDSITPIFESTGSYNYNFTLEQTSPDTVTGIIIKDQGNPFNSQYINLYQNPIPEGDISPLLDFEIPFDHLLLDDTTICLHITYLSDAEECCHFEHCLTIEPINPYEYVNTTSMEGDGNCCHELELSQLGFDGAFSRVITESLTPGVIFEDFPSFSNGWGTAINNDSTSITWSHVQISGNGFPNGVFDGIRFCLKRVGGTPQSPQIVAVHWMSINPITGEEYVACTEFLEYDCSGCLYVDGEILCGNEGVYFLNYTVTNNSDRTATSILFENHSPDVIFGEEYVPAINLAPGESYSGTSILDDSVGDPVQFGDLIEFKVALFDDTGWCCHVDDVSFAIPDCQFFGCECGTTDEFFADIAEGFTYEINCDNDSIRFSANASSHCDEIIWWFKKPNYPFYQIKGVRGDERPVFSFDGNGVYEVKMEAIRYDGSGNRCFSEYLVNLHIGEIEIDCGEFYFPPYYDFAVGKTPALNIFPNPSKDLINVKLPSIESSKLEIVGLNGKIYKTIFTTENQESILQIDISEMPDGLYFVQYQSGREKIEQRFVKVK